MTQTSTPPPADYPPPRYAWYVVIVLMLCYTLSFIDRQIMAFLVGPIKHDLGISDTEVGLLGGFAFALFYTCLGLPMGWLADRLSRRNIIAAGLVFWSLATAACALARSFGSLFAARVGVGVGEATLSPSAMSLLSDYFPKDKLGTALSVYSMGILIGSGLASIAGGAIVQTVAAMPPVAVPILGVMAAWRLTFLVVGLPGALVALILFTVREPVRRGVIRAQDGTAARLPLRDIAREIASRWTSVLGVSLGIGFHAMSTYALTFWGPPFFLRVYGWRPVDVGLAIGIVTIVFGCLGMIAGGRLCDHWLQNGKSEAGLAVGVLGTLTSAVAIVCAMLAPSPAWCLVFLAPAMFFQGFPIGSSYAALQWIFPNQVRGMVSALLMFILNLVGMGLGPLVPGLLNDRLFHDGQMVGYSIAITVAVAATLAGTVYRLTYAPYRRDYAAMHQA